MNYQPTKKTKKESIVKDSAIDRNKGKLVGTIGYWLYRLIRPFKRITRTPHAQFLLMMSRVPLKQKKHYWNKFGVECVDFDCNGSNLVVGYNKGYLLLRLHNYKQAVDKSLILNPTNKGLQDLLGVINSMQVNLRDKVSKAA